MKKRIIAIVLISLLFMAVAFSQELMTNTQTSNTILQNQNKSLEARVAALEAKVTRLEQMVQNPPVRIIPCDSQ